MNAGDTGTSANRAALRDGIKLPYVEALGNHDYYGETLLYRDGSEGLGTERDKIFWSHEFNGLKIWAGTLWCSLSNPITALAAQRGISDFQYIKVEGGTILPYHLTEMFRQSINSISMMKPDVVLSHFPPLPLSRNPKYDPNDLDGYFYNDVAWLMNKVPTIRLWIHGHTHHPVDYNFNGVRVVSNPIGYPREIACAKVKVVNI